MISVMDVQPWKAHSPIALRAGGSVISAKDVQPKKPPLSDVGEGGGQRDLGQDRAAQEGRRFNLSESGRHDLSQGRAAVKGTLADHGVAGGSVILAKDVHL